MNHAYLCWIVRRTVRRIVFATTLLAFWPLLGCNMGSSSKPSGPPPIVPQITTFSASPTDVNGGQTTTITWATTNSASISIAPAIPVPDGSGPLPTSGSDIVPITATTTYTLTATSSDGTTATKTLSVTVPFTLT
jgi:hypothetical protein